MALGVIIEPKRPRGHLRRPPPWALLGLALASASCVPVATAGPQHVEIALPAVAEAPAPTLNLLATPASAPVASSGPAPGAFVFDGRTPLDRMRSLDCLAQAIYYEARSESEDGQRAVAQVVLNRVRHPAWPNSVCGVVYQGPMRAGGGCQFTFTCDGSLSALPQGIGWARARQLAAEALAGSTYAPVGLSTHYHTSAVFPSWAPRLASTGRIGAHNFYRLPGVGPGAFTAAYAGSEPMPRPNPILFPRRLSASFAEFVPQTPAEVRAAVIVPSDIPQNPRWTASNLPESTVREEYRQSGQWRDDAPAAIAGSR